MIEYVKGELTGLTPAAAVVECAGVGYLLNISLNTYSAVQGKKEVKLYVHEVISEDARTLFGFSLKSERELFLQLLSVSGVGGNTARVILSSFTPSELTQVIATGNERMLKSVKGIGLKTAQRIIVDLKDKIGGIDTTGVTSTFTGIAAATTQGSAVLEDAVAALTMLGFQTAASRKVVEGILKNEPTMTVEQVIKDAMKRL